MAASLTHVGDRSKEKKVLIIYTGGTMGMKPTTPSGALDVCPGFFSEQIQRMPEMTHPKLPAFDLYEWPVLQDSACMGPQHWIQLAGDIEQHYYNYSGFVVCHGTDTMAYTASALSFMLEHLGKPVILTGSQIPLAEVYTDARHNLVSSLLFACGEECTEVAIFFGNRLLRGCRASKVHSFDLNAFASPNFPPLATLGVNLEFSSLALAPPRKPLRVHKAMDANIVVVRLIPGFEDDALFAMIEHAQHLHAIILQLYGTGNGDTSTRSGLLQAMSLATKRSIVVVALTQCHRGGVLLDKYSVGLALREAGVVSGGDMTVEAAAAKLAYLFSRTGGNTAQVKSLLGKDLRGELSSDARYERTIQSAPHIMSKL